MKYFLFLLALASLSPAVYGQEDLETRKALAKDLIAFSKFSEALTVLRNDRELRLRDKEGRFLIAVCLYQVNDLNEAEDLLVQQIEEEKAPYAECWLFLGKIFHARHQFSEAARYYKIYLRRTSAQHPNRRMVLDEIRRCANGLRQQYSDNRVFVESLGPDVNTPYDEFGAIPSPNFQTRLYFSARRPGNIGGPRTPQGKVDQRYGTYYSDIYSASNEAGRWGGVQSLHHLLNSPQHEAILDFNQDGSVMYFFQGNNWYNGRILLDTFRREQDRRLRSDPFLGPVETVLDQAAPHFVNANTVIFPSRRANGFGGLDLYITTYAGGRWSAPENLGPAINSPYDETTPFLAPDGRTLYFSSNRSDKSIGGYDVFKSVYFAEHDLWSIPQNQGLPINSSADDTHFRLTNDGFSALFTSSRKDGPGGRDLYVAYYQDFLREQEPPASLAQTYFYRSAAPATNALSAGPQAPSVPMGAPRTRKGDVPWPIPFREQADLFKKENLESMDRIAALLQATPEQYLLIDARGPFREAAPAAAYALVKDASMLGEYLAGKGIARTRIRVLGQAGELRSKGAAEERSADFHFINRRQSAATSASGASFCYRIQVARAVGAEVGEAVEGLPQLTVEKPLDEPFYYYWTGSFDTYAEALAWWEENRQTNRLPDAMIVPFFNGWSMNKELAAQYQEAFPDLRQYLDAVSKK